MISYDIEQAFESIIRAMTYTDLDKLVDKYNELYDTNQINTTEWRMIHAWLSGRYLRFDVEQF